MQSKRFIAGLKIGEFPVGKEESELAPTTSVEPPSVTKSGSKSKVIFASIGVIIILALAYFYYHSFGSPVTSTELTDEKRHTIYVASISWHTGIIVPGYSIPDSLWPVQHNFSKFDYLEIGWGDRDFYQHPKFNLWYIIKAVLWPTPTALHIVPLKEENIEINYIDTKVVKLKITQKELNDLSHFLVSQFELNEQGKVIPLNEGFYINSQFFAGSGKYYFPKNSNVWAAKALKTAGFSFTPIFYQTTGMVVNKADNFGKVVVDKD